MKRLFAALCESATTTLKNGRFLAPPRASRITTMSGIPPVEKGVILRDLGSDWQGKRLLLRGRFAPIAVVADVHFGHVPQEQLRHGVRVPVEPRTYAVSHLDSEIGLV